MGCCLFGCGLFFVCGDLCVCQSLSEERQPLHSIAMRVEVPRPLLLETEIMLFQHGIVKSRLHPIVVIY